ncbi:MAG TPA: hypothetical protein VES66_09495 [Terriglobales bacterium]|nr:hypothetical protein [Terriglobales bacterium]
MVPYHKAPEHIAPAHRAPRCQHIRLNGRGCGSPALRGESLCYFHNRALQFKELDYTLPFIEDATSLQFALMQVIRLLQSGHANYKECGLLLYSLQIVSSNLKAVSAEQPRPELTESEEPKRARSENGKDAGQNNGDEPSLAEFLLGMLAKSDDDPEAEAPRIRSREDYYAAVERRRRPDAGLPAAPSAP